MDNSYYTKYIKYKNKYLELKNLLEGGEIKNPTNCAITTHNGRLRCLLTSIGFPTTKMINLPASDNSDNSDTLGSITEVQTGGGDKEKEVELRFKNCAVVLMKIDSLNNTISISLVHDGEITEKPPKEKKSSIFKNPFSSKDKSAEPKPEKKYYYVINPQKPNEVKFSSTTYSGEKYSSILKTLHIKPEDFGQGEINFYMIRHGEGIHNLDEGIGKITKLGSQYVDAGLTPSGITQASNAASSLNEIKFDYVFVSDLARTRQTIQQILKSNKYNGDIKKVYVLPCSHELDFVKGGNCDGAQKLTMFENENKMSCPVISNTCDLIDNDKLCCIIDILKDINNNRGAHLKVDWEFYR
jgi:hypothetical protein